MSKPHILPSKEASGQKLDGSAGALSRRSLRGARARRVILRLTGPLQERGNDPISKGESQGDRRRRSGRGRRNGRGRVGGRARVGRTTGNRYRFVGRPRNRRRGHCRGSRRTRPLPLLEEAEERNAGYLKIPVTDRERSFSFSTALSPSSRPASVTSAARSARPPECGRYPSTYFCSGNWYQYMP